MPDILSVSKLTEIIKNLIESTYPYPLLVEGELSNFKIYPTGHLYFTLKDKDSQVNCIFFHYNSKKEKIELKDGLKVVCRGRLNVYKPRGYYSLIVDEISPKGIGELELAFQRLKERLKKEGLFKEEHKLPLPLFPKRIGVITSSAGAAIRDLLKMVDKRYPGVHIIVYPVHVQGKEATGEIAGAIKDFNRWNNVDVLVVTRGGGSLEDLWAFNEEEVARAIYESCIPTVSAIGHQVDFTISDFVADHRSPTPTAVAEHILPSRDELLQRIDHLLSRLRQKLLNLIPQTMQRLDELTIRSKRIIGHMMDRKESRLKALKGRLEALNPEAVLSRGYSITSIKKTDKVLLTSDTLKQGDEVVTRLYRGVFISKVAK